MPSVRGESETTGVNRVALWFSVFGAPALWSVQVIAGFALVAHGCYPRTLPLATPTLDVRALASMISVVAAIVTIVAGALAFAIWRRVSRELRSSGHPKRDVRLERTRFMAFAGILTSTLFLLAIALSFVSIWTLPPCTYGA